VGVNAIGFIRYLPIKKHRDGVENGGGAEDMGGESKGPGKRS